MDMNDKTKKIIALLLVGVVALLVINLISNRRISRLEAALNNINSNLMFATQDTRSVQSMIWDIQNRIDGVNDQIIRGAKLTFDEAVVIQAYHAITSLADVEVSFYLRTHNPADAVSVTARGRYGGVHSAEAVVSNGGRVTAAMTLPLQDNYVFTFTTGGETITTGELVHFNLADKLCGRFMYGLGFGHTTAPGGVIAVNLHPHFENRTQGNPALEAVSLALFIETEDGDIIATFDLTEYLIDIGNAQMLERGSDMDLSLPVGEGFRHIDPDVYTMARLVITDGLGIRYEQLDILSSPGMFSGRGGAWGMQTRAFFYETSGDLGRIRIAE